VYIIVSGSSVRSRAAHHHLSLRSTSVDHKRRIQQAQRCRINMFFGTYQSRMGHQLTSMRSMHVVEMNFYRDMFVFLGHLANYLFSISPVAMTAPHG
jgi:hypothetical protein